jgi:hypothetical protein
MKNFFKKFPMIALIVGLGLLLVMQQKVIMPFVYEVVGSDLFLVQSKEEASQFPVSTHMTESAFSQCNNYIKTEMDPKESITFAEKPINSWSEGNYDYLINGEVTITDETANTSTKKYACRISYNKKEDESGLDDAGNWTVEGLVGLDK